MIVKNENDLLNLLDTLVREPKEFWDSFYQDKEKKIPFFCNFPDEHLVKYIENELIQPKHVLELGCGNGRNAIYLASMGCKVTAVDLAAEAILWAQAEAENQQVDIQFICSNIFELDLPRGDFDFIYDSGCFHHLAPHRRISYIQLLRNYLCANGHFSINAFKENGVYGGAALSDEQVYKEQSLHGGLGYSKQKYQEIFDEFQEIEIRDMQFENLERNEFGLEGFITCLFKK